jgi:hypothetical protein
MTILLSIFFSLSVWAKVGLELTSPTTKIRQGELVSGKLLLKEAAVPPGLSGQTIKDTLYLYRVGPFLRQSGEAALVADVTFVFVQVPGPPILTDKIGSEEVEVVWRDFEISPTESPSELLFTDFTVPLRRRWLWWGISALGLIMAGVFGWQIFRRHSLKKQLQQSQRSLKQELLQATDYTQVVGLWKKKRDFLKTFPQLEESFTTMEMTLFKYQFKPTQTEAEIRLVLEAYEHFKLDVGGKLHGI